MCVTLIIYISPQNVYVLYIWGLFRSGAPMCEYVGIHGMEIFKTFLFKAIKIPYFTLL